MNVALYSNAFDEFISLSKYELCQIKNTENKTYERVMNEIDNARITYDKYSNFFEEVSPTPGFKEVFEDKISRILHFIWIGPKNFPEKSLINILRCKELNPEVEIFFWTDKNRFFPESVSSIITIKNLDNFFDEVYDKYHEIISCYNNSLSFGEKSDLIRYLLLAEFGGIYVDHDIEPLKSFDHLFNYFSFFCFAENIWPMIDKSYFKISNACIGACRNNRIILKTIDDVKRNWGNSTKLVQSVNLYTYSFDQPTCCESFKYLLDLTVFFRTFLPFTISVKSTELSINEIIFPPQFFSNQHNQKSQLLKHAIVDHKFDGLWLSKPNESKEIKLVEKRKIKKIEKKARKLTYAIYLQYFLIIAFFLIVTFFMKKDSKRGL